MLNGRAYGVFQQANVLASFLATGLALALMLFLLPAFTCDHTGSERLRIQGLGLMLVLFSVVLVWLQSRIGWIGGAAVALLFLTRFHSLPPPACQMGGMPDFPTISAAAAVSIKWGFATSTRAG
ncbi:pilin glycosylation ligase domain-containing protein [Serratia sp. 2723]|uniref:pilin glycosylation ligase domain-containing protein n=1 Tax=unclassified Serratia (in: enterobacteria) TaxID=2647522 RepID=UPI003D208AE0